MSNGFNQPACLIVAAALEGDGDIEYADDIGPVVVHGSCRAVPCVFFKTVMLGARQLHGRAFGKAGFRCRWFRRPAPKGCPPPHGKRDVVPLLMAGVKDNSVFIGQRNGSVQHVDGLEQLAHDGGGAVYEIPVAFQYRLQFLRRDKFPLFAIRVDLIVAGPNPGSIQSPADNGKIDFSALLKEFPLFFYGISISRCG